MFFCKLFFQNLEQVEEYLLKSAFNLTVEVTECRSSMRVQYRGIYRWIIIVNVTASMSFVDKAIFQHVFCAKEQWKPFIVVDVLILSNIDAT